MAARRKRIPIRTKIGRFRGDRRTLAALILFALGVAGFSWVKAHPEHNPAAPFDLRHPVGWATASKLVALRADPLECRAALERSDVPFNALEPVGEGNCARPDRTQLTDYPLSPNTPATTCPVAAAMELWRTKIVEPAAQEIFGSGLARMEHMGVYNCRTVRGGSTTWSQHATGNAIDISAFILEDGTRISLIKDWDGSEPKARFLRQVRDGACGVFATVLSPDYNALHADHFHLDQDARWTGVCR
ncbi:MAG: extensin family protein [Pseudomonadota bacterium]